MVSISKRHSTDDYEDYCSEYPVRALSVAHALFKTITLNKFRINPKAIEIIHENYSEASIYFGKYECYVQRILTCKICDRKKYDFLKFSNNTELRKHINREHNKDETITEAAKQVTKDHDESDENNKNVTSLAIGSTS